MTRNGEKVHYLNACEDNQPSSLIGLETSGLLWQRLLRVLVRVAPKRRSFHAENILIWSLHAALKFIYLIFHPRLRLMSIISERRLWLAQGIITRRTLHKHSTWVKWTMPEISPKSLFFCASDNRKKQVQVDHAKAFEFYAYVHYNCLFMAMKWS